MGKIIGNACAYVAMIAVSSTSRIIDCSWLPMLASILYLGARVCILRVGRNI